jgi:PhzF family phenazine biosynthesis protein
MSIQKIAAFSNGVTGSNPAGVMLGEVLPSDTEKQRITAEVGFSETAFAAPVDTGWRVRYFSPESEVPFCGHATMALATAAGYLRDVAWPDGVVINVVQGGHGYAILPAGRDTTRARPLNPRVRLGADHDR